MHLPPRREGRGLLGRHSRPRRQSLAGRHALAVVFHVEGRHFDADAHVRRPGPARLRRSGAQVLARVRARGQGGHHGAPGDVPRGRLVSDPADGRPRAPDARLGIHGRGARRRDPVSRAGPLPRLPRLHLRLARRRADPARHGQTVHRAARVGDRAPARSRRALHRAARRPDAPPRAADPVRDHQRERQRAAARCAAGCEGSTACCAWSASRST